MDLKTIPETSGVYQYFDKNGELIYIGKAINLKKRVKSYFQKNILTPKTRELVKRIARIQTIKAESEFDALLLEAKLIRVHKPKYNVVWRDDKHPLYIKITAEEFPKLRTSRREDDSKAMYYGPFPSSRIVKETLRFIRQIFPYCNEKSIGKRACFYSHIGLCDPCPNNIVHMSEKDYKQERRKYLHNIAMIKRLLDGKSASVISYLTKRMDAFSSENKFEEAAKIKRQLGKLAYLTQERTPVKEYMKNPNLYDDIRREELNELARKLKIGSISRIEGYDISNTQGTNATGSMVTFVDGEPEKSFYRKFKIRTKNSPDDPHMMHEMLLRRLKHTDWPYPDLIMVDGGKTQINASLHAMKRLSISFPLIGLAKRLEEIIIPQPDGTYRTVRLPRSSSALQLLQRIRNEAHRFANTYHRKLRNRQSLE